MSDKNGRLRIGLIGAGWPGERHAEGILANTEADIHAIADLDEMRRTYFTRRYGVPHHYGDYRDLITDDEIDAVVIALPNFLHRRAVIDALEAGKHVLCEKPPSVTTNEAIEMANVANEHGLVLGYATWRRFTPSAELLFTRQGEKELGEIYHARSVWTRAWGVPRGVGGWFTDPERAGGGPLIDIGIHVLDLAWFIMGCPNPVAVSGQIYNKYPAETSTEDSAFAFIRFEGGRTLQLETSWVLASAEDEKAVHLYGTKGGARVDDDNLQFFTVGQGGVASQSPRVSRGLAPAFAAQALDFVRAIKEGEQPRTTAQQGVVLMSMLEGIYQSAQDGRELELEPITA